MKRLIREHVEFFQQYRQTFQTTGALAPSSRYVARALARPIERHKGPARILEVGPGTGAVTRRIVKLLKPDDQLDLVELNDKFVDVLKRRLKDDPDFRAVADRVRVHHLPIQEFVVETPYDFIVSGLPFTNFSPDMVREIFTVFFKLLAPHGVLTYFEYQYMRRLKRAFVGGEARQNIDRLDDVLREHLDRHRVKRHSVIGNIPPVWVHELRHAEARASRG